MKKAVLLSLSLFSLGTAATAFGLTLEAGDMRIGINGYLNANYTYMSAMQMPMGGVITKMTDFSSFETDANLIFNAVRDRFRTNLNLQFHHAVRIEGQNNTDNDDTTGAFNLIEVFGEYQFMEPLSLRAGQFLSPFGIYNQIRFVTPLFAPVVLPMMYEPPANFTAGALVPSDANVMAHGTWTHGLVRGQYFLYVGNGQQAASGDDQNKDKGWGGRIKLNLLEQFQVGVSYYTAKDTPATSGRQRLYGVDLDADLGPLNLQGEYVLDDLDRREDRQSYYGRLTYTHGPLSPFIGYDYIEDKANLLFKRGQHRYSAGLSYTPDPQIFLKAEYHYHLFEDTDDFAGAPAQTHMIRIATIFIF